MNNLVIENKIHNYMMKPGDGTVYRFSIQFFPDTKEWCKYGDAYILASGVGADAPEQYAWISVYMPAGCGVAVIRLGSLKEFEEHPGWLHGYLQTHGMGAVDNYTLSAVLLAASVLIDDLSDIENAKVAMLRVPQLDFG